MRTFRQPQRLVLRRQQLNNKKVINKNSIIFSIFSRVIKALKQNFFEHYRREIRPTFLKLLLHVDLEYEIKIEKIY